MKGTRSYKWLMKKFGYSWYLRNVYNESKEKRRLDVFEYWEKYNYVDYSAMIDELAKRTKLPRFICKLVYSAEDSILEDLGIIK